MKSTLIALFILASTTALADSTDKLTEIISTHKQTISKQTTCLTKAIYFEADNFEKSQRDVANVIINRVLTDQYPPTVCKVVHEKTKNKRTGKRSCQFSFLCGSPKVYNTSSEKWKNAESVAAEVMDQFVNQTRTDTSRGATHFHDKRVLPKWAKSKAFVRTVRTGTLSFYKQR